MSFVVKEYTTVAASGSFELIVKRSRFIGCALHIESLDECMDAIKKIREAHRDASHTVHALRLEGGCEHGSDDGEPSGTAYRPIASLLRKRDLHDVLVCVTRYFGGTKLGAGGLLRAYGGCAAGALDSSALCLMVAAYVFRIAVPYERSPRLENMLRVAGADIVGIDYASDTVHFDISAQNEKEIRDLIFSELGPFWPVACVSKGYKKVR